QRSAAAGGLLFTRAEVTAFNELARECGQPEWNVAAFRTALA
ncbi:MAG: lactate dehydrogenase, partial [Verrucomicrobia bacterium]